MTDPNKPMKPERLASVADLLRAWSFGSGSETADLVRELLADRDWHRAQVKVTEKHVRDAGVTWEHASLWLRANDVWCPCNPVDGTDARNRLIVQLVALATTEGKGASELDVLGAMAAMEV
jgi:hypothetical protein